jgi:hypothetical protein
MTGGFFISHLNKLMVRARRKETLSPRSLVINWVVVKTFPPMMLLTSTPKANQQIFRMTDLGFLPTLPFFPKSL